MPLLERRDDVAAVADGHDELRARRPRANAAEMADVPRGLLDERRPPRVDRLTEQRCDGGARRPPRPDERRRLPQGHVDVGMRGENVRQQRGPGVAAPADERDRLQAVPSRAELRLRFAAQCSDHAQPEPILCD